VVTVLKTMKLILAVYAVFICRQTLASVDSCSDLFIGIETSETIAARVHRVPSTVIPELALPIANLFAAGPNHWVPTGRDDSRLIRYQRGLSGGHLRTGGGAQEAIELITGKPSRRSHSVFLIPNLEAPAGWRARFETRARAQEREEMREEVHGMSNVYAFPLAIRARASHSLKIPESGARRVRPMERQIEAGESVGSMVSELGLFYASTDSRNASYIMTWVTEYLEFSNFLFEGGMQVSSQSRGYRFFKELDAAYREVDPKIKRLYGHLRSNTSFDSYTLNPYKIAYEEYFMDHRHAMDSIISILNRYAGNSP
jgi:hypothetical protein